MLPLASDNNVVGTEDKDGTVFLLFVDPYDPKLVLEALLQIDKRQLLAYIFIMK
jgi:hypothetical protein